MKIAVVTVSRAEYGILRNLLKKIDQDPELQLQLIVTGSHLIRNSGNTIADIKKDKLKIAKKVNMRFKSDSPAGISTSIGNIVKGMAKALQQLRPDLLVLISDRYETLAAAVASIPFNIPVAHIAGGVVTEGAIDDKIRHSITKIAHLHFPVNQEGYNNLLKMGEEKSRIHNTGSMAIDLIKEDNLLTKSQLESLLKINLNKFILFVYHPVTLEYKNTQSQINNILNALSKTNMPIITLHPNQDTSRSIILKSLEKAAKNNKNIKLFKHFPRNTYLSLMKHCSVMVGNSSSGILEAPTLKTAVVNISSRQQGRGRALNVIDTNPSTEEILQSINKALSKKFQKQLKSTKNPFGDGKATERILKILKTTKINANFLQKRLK